MTETSTTELECGKCHYRADLAEFGLDKPPGDYDTLYVCPRCHKAFKPKSVDKPAGT